MYKVVLVGQPEVVNRTGGAISVFKHMCNLFVEEGFDVTGVCSSPQNRRPEFISEQVKFVNLQQDYDYCSGFSEAFKSLLRESRPDLIIFFFHYLYIQASLGKEFNDIPRVLMFHSRPDFYFEYIPHSERNLKRLYRNTVSQILLESYRDYLPDFIRKNKVVTIPNYVANSGYSVNYKNSSDRMVYFSRVDRAKGVELLIEAFSLLKDSFPTWRVDVFGDVESDEYLQSLNKKIASLGLEDNFFLKGVTNDKFQTLSRYDFCVFPSFFEGFSLGLAEAMSVGLPCVGLSSCTSVNELILDGINGFLCDKTPESLSAAMRKLMESSSLRQTMGERAKTYILQYSEDIFKQRWLNLVYSIINNRMSPRVTDVREIIKYQ